MTAAKDQKIWLGWDFSDNPGMRYEFTDGNPMSYVESNGILDPVFVAGGVSKVKYSLYAVCKISTNITIEKNEVPRQYSLRNYPNSFNPSTKISFTLPESSDVRLDVYNILGEKVAELLNEKKSAGSYEVLFDVKNFAGGLYFYRISINKFTLVKKMILLK